MRRNLLFPALAFVLAVCACDATSVRSQMSHTPPGQPAAQPPIDTCSLLNQQTAESLYGAARRMDLAGAGMFNCLYGDAKKGVRDAVGLTIQRVPQGMDGGVFFDSLTKDKGGPHTTPVAGLGERAAYTSDGTAIELVVLSHGKIMMAGINGPDTPARRAALLPVLRGILGKV
jgi:hypothetical protein